jgi:hypothetical protein
VKIELDLPEEIIDRLPADETERKKAVTAAIERWFRYSSGDAFQVGTGVPVAKLNGEKHYAFVVEYAAFDRPPVFGIIVNAKNSAGSSITQHDCLLSGVTLEEAVCEAQKKLDYYSAKRQQFLENCRKGGLAKSEKKAAAAQKNGLKGGRIPGKKIDRDE